MALLDRMRKQKAVYWERTGADGNGAPVYAGPRELRVRWENRHKEYVLPSGEKYVSNARVFAGEELVMGSLLWEGELDAVLYIDDPRRNANAREIVLFDSIPNLKATDKLRVAVV